MKQYFFKAFGTLAFAGIMSTCALAQSNNNSKNSNQLDDHEQIIIRKKSDKKSKVTVEIKDGEVKVNGKPLSEFNDDNVTVIIEDEGMSRVWAPGSARSAFRTDRNAFALAGPNRPVLGVLTDDDEDGAKITSVTKGSGAEKAGLKAGDVITKVNGVDIDGPGKLTETIGKLKPEDKVDITIKRENKEQKVTATLGKRASANTVFSSPDMDFDNFKLDMANGYFNRGRLGIKAQDTEDEKGVKVLEVDADSHAAKSGIKEGDIIMQFNGEEVNSATELAEAAREARELNNIKIKIRRDGKSQDMEIKIPKKLKTANL